MNFNLQKALFQMQNSQSLFHFGLKTTYVLQQNLFSTFHPPFHNNMITWWHGLVPLISKISIIHGSSNSFTICKRNSHYGSMNGSIFFVKSQIFFLIKFRMVLTFFLAFKKAFVFFDPSSACIFKFFIHFFNPMDYVWIMFLLGLNFSPPSQS